MRVCRTQFSIFICIDDEISLPWYLRRAAQRGQSVLLPCHRDVGTHFSWKFQSHQGYRNDVRRIAHNGVVTSEFEGRYQLDDKGLLIREVQQEDQGNFTCVDMEDVRLQSHIQLFVPCESTY